MLAIAGQLFLKFHGATPGTSASGKDIPIIDCGMCNKELFDVKRKSRKDKRGCLRY